MGNNKQDLDEEINAITIKIKRGSWEFFKSITPRNITLNQAVVNLINREKCSKKYIVKIKTKQSEVSKQEAMQSQARHSSQA